MKLASMVRNILPTTGFGQRNKLVVLFGWQCSKRQILFRCKGFKCLILRQIVSSEILTYLDDLQTSHQLNLLPPKIVLRCL